MVPQGALTFQTVWKRVTPIIVRLDNEDLGRRFRDAVWPRTGLVFMGFDVRGRQGRIVYFDGVQI